MPAETFPKALLRSSIRWQRAPGPKKPGTPLRPQARVLRALPLPGFICILHSPFTHHTEAAPPPHTRLPSWPQLAPLTVISSLGTNQPHTDIHIQHIWAPAKCLCPPTDPHLCQHTCAPWSTWSVSCLCQVFNAYLACLNEAEQRLPLITSDVAEQVLLRVLKQKQVSQPKGLGEWVR
jgi:hypothetical protein